MNDVKCQIMYQLSFIMDVLKKKKTAALLDFVQTKGGRGECPA